MENQSLQGRTGQVAPSAQNPQGQTQQSYQSGQGGLQNTNSQLLQNVQPLDISVASENNSTKTAQTQAVPARTNSLLLPGLGFAVAISLLLLVIARKKPVKQTKATPKPIQVSDTPVAVKVATPKPATKKKSTKKKSKKKSKKKK